MKAARFFLALALLVTPMFVAALDACPACKRERPLNQRNVYNEPTVRDEVRLNALDIYSEPTLRDEVRLNALDIYSEPTLRDTIVDETIVN